MAVAAVAADVPQPLDVLTDLSAEGAFNQNAAVDDADDLGQFLFTQLLSPALRVNGRLLEDLLAVGAPHPVDVGEADPDRLVRRNVDACDTRHECSEE